jgi:hypothetical protein
MNDNLVVTSHPWGRSKRDRGLPRTARSTPAKKLKAAWTVSGKSCSLKEFAKKHDAGAEWRKCKR